MENWKMAQLRGHLQFTLGRIDSLRWALERVDLLQEEDSFAEKQQIQDRIREHQATAQDCEGLIAKILEARNLAKEAEKTRKLAVHADLGSIYG